MNGWTFALAALVAIGLGVLLWRAMKMDRGATASLKVGNVFDAQIVLDGPTVARATEAARAAEEARGETGAEPLSIQPSDSVQLARILWVDDNPDNNVFEVIAAENLGFFVTAATSTAAAKRYAVGIEFSVIVTDVLRGSNHDAGLEIIEWATEALPNAPVVVYTSTASAHADLLAAGATAVVDTPSSLLNVINALRQQTSQ